MDPPDGKHPRALASVFPEVLVLPGTTTVITASRIPLPRSADILNERLRKRAIQTRLVSPPYIRYLFTNDRRFDLEKRLKKAAVPMNTDIRPVCYPSAVMIWLARFFPKLALTDLPGFGEEANGPGVLWWLVGLGVPLLFLVGRLRPAWRRNLLVAVARISRTRLRVGPYPRLPGRGGHSLPGYRTPPDDVHGRPRHRRLDLE